MESTPKITYREVKENKADGISQEAQFAARLTARNITEWETGKLLHVTSDRIGLILSPDNPTERDLMPAEKDTVRFAGLRTITDLTGKEVVEVMLQRADGKGGNFAYRTGNSPEELRERSISDVPFTIDLDFVEEWNNAIAGKELYIKTPLWLDGAGEPMRGRKFVKVKIEEVKAANEVYPFIVVFNDENGEKKGVFMAASSEARWAPRTFPSIFSFTDPHLQYPKITDAMWEYIIKSRVTEGMTKTEASLALGTPAHIDRGHDQSTAFERWRYSDGVYLIFEDGLLARHN